MKVLFLTAGFPSTDAPFRGIFNYRAVKSLSDFADVTVVHYRSWRRGRRLKVKYSYEGVRVTVLALPWFPSKGALQTALNIRAWSSLSLKLLEKELNNTDLIHTVGLDSGGVIGSFLSKKTGIPHVSQCIGSDIVFHLKKIVKYPWIKYWWKETRLVICNSDFLSDLVVNDFPHLKTKTVYRGTNLQTFSPTKTTKRLEDPIRFLFIGGFADRSTTDFGADLKGGETIKLAWKLIDEMHNINAELWLGGPDSNGAAIVEWTNQLNRKNAVKLLGNLSPEQVVQAYADTHVVLLPSRSEGLPNVAVEACACAKVLIGTRVGGVPEVVIDQETGFLIEPGDHQVLFQKMLFVLKEYESLTPLRLHARKRIESLFDASKYGHSLFNLYESVLQ